MAVVIDTGALQAIITAGLSIAVTSGAWAWRYGRKIGPLLKTLAQFSEDWNGVDERPGFDRRPGMAERIRAVERSAEAQGDALEAVRRELVANGGGSLRDQVRRIEQAQRATLVALPGAAAPLPLPAAEVEALRAGGHQSYAA